MRCLLSFAPVALLCAACSAPPPPPVATVDVAPPPPAPRPSAPAARAPAAVDSEEPAEPEGLNCDKQLDNVRSVPRNKVEDCDELAQQIVSIQNICAPDVDSAFAILEGAECVRDIADVQFAKLKVMLPAADVAAQEKAHRAFESDVQAYCTRGDCGVHYGAVCATGLVRAHEAWLEMAQAGELTIEDAKPQRKVIQGFSDFAKGFCALPKSAWKGGARPKSCEGRVLAALESAQGPEMCKD